MNTRHLEEAVMAKFAVLNPHALGGKMTSEGGITVEASTHEEAARIVTGVDPSSPVLPGDDSIDWGDFKVFSFDTEIDPSGSVNVYVIEVKQ